MMLMLITLWAYTTAPFLQKGFTSGIDDDDEGGDDDDEEEEEVSDDSGGGGGGAGGEQMTAKNSSIRSGDLNSDTSSSKRANS
jgi:hypothetical protein